MLPAKHHMPQIEQNIPIGVTKIVYEQMISSKSTESNAQTKRKRWTLVNATVTAGGKQMKCKYQYPP